METIVQKIERLKKERRAVILAHNYQLPEVQDIADFVGDSFELSRKAANTSSDVIVFCGVHFMAETAKILSPQKQVLIPDMNAGCPMADMITQPALAELKKKHPLAVVVAYVNTPASVKAEADYCCTSGNAIEVVNSLPEDKEIIFVPDKYLANYVSEKTGRKFIAWHGYCPTHVKILPQDIEREKKLHPNAEVVVHPECTPDVVNMADKVFSTSGISRYVKTANAKEIIIGTEPGIIHRLKKENPDKKFYPVSEAATCPNMKKINLEKVLWSLEDMKFEVNVPDEIRLRAEVAVKRMLEVVR